MTTTYDERAALIGAMKQNADAALCAESLAVIKRLLSVTPALLEEDLDGCGNTCVHMAAMMGRRDVLEWLLFDCATSAQHRQHLLLRQTSSGQTPIHGAAHCVARWVAEQCPEALSVRNQDGRTAEEHARWLGLTKTATMLSSVLTGRSPTPSPLPGISSPAAASVISYSRQPREKMPALSLQVPGSPSRMLSTASSPVAATFPTVVPATLGVRASSPVAVARGSPARSLSPIALCKQRTSELLAAPISTSPTASSTRRISEIAELRAALRQSEACVHSLERALARTEEALMEEKRQNTELRMELEMLRRRR